MQEFDSAAGRHTFKVDGREFYLPLPAISDVKTFVDLAELPTPDEKASAMLEALTSRIRPVRLTVWEKLVGRNPAVKALGTLGLRQASDLFTAWAEAGGLLSGESSGSAN